MRRLVSFRMALIVIPFRGAVGKSRLEPLPKEARFALAHAMLADVRNACAAVAETVVATGSGGQGAAVAEALRGIEGPVAVVNADLPCITPADVQALLAAAPALVAAREAPRMRSLCCGINFRPLFGPGSATRFGGLGLQNSDCRIWLTMPIRSPTWNARSPRRREHRAVLESMRSRREGCSLSGGVGGARSCGDWSTSSRLGLAVIGTSATTSRCLTPRLPGSVQRPLRLTGLATTTRMGRRTRLERARDGSLLRRGRFRLGDRDLGLHLVLTRRRVRASGFRR